MNQTPSTPVTITNIDIPFGRLILIILKWMFASIPAMIIFYLIVGGVFLIFAVIVATLTGGSSAFLDQLRHALQNH